LARAIQLADGDEMIVEFAGFAARYAIRCALSEDSTFTCTPFVETIARFASVQTINNKPL